MTSPRDPESEAAGAPAERASASQSEDPTPAHSVTDRYVARRVAEHAVAQAEVEQTAQLTEGARQSTMTFYVLLGIVISILLLILIFHTAEPPRGSTGPSPSRSLTTPG